MRLKEVVKQDTPRGVVLWDKKSDTWQWGVLGNLPVLETIGVITKVQRELDMGSGNEPCHQCDYTALVIPWVDEKDVNGVDTGKKVFEWFVHPDIPVDALVGYLEMVKQSFINNKGAQQAAAQYVALLGPDGQPIRR